MSKSYRSFHNILKSVGFLLLMLVVNSCYKNRVGCLDILSSNYSIGADDACDDCCSFPKMLFKINHTFSGENFSLDREYSNNIGSRFIIREQQFFFGGLSFFDENGSKIPIIDSIGLTSVGVLKTFAQDFTTIRATVASARVGSAKYSGRPIKMSFNLGLSDQLNTIDSLSSTKLESLVRSKENYLNGKYQSFYFKLNRVGINQDIVISSTLSYPFTFSLTNVEVKAGAPLTFDLKINYAVLFDDISFPTMTNEEINTRVLANIQKAITLN